MRAGRPLLVALAAVALAAALAGCMRKSAPRPVAAAPAPVAAQAMPAPVPPPVVTGPPAAAMAQAPAAEPVIEIAAETATDLLRIAWHLGNRHLPLQALQDRLRIRADHVIAAMIEGLGGRITWCDAPFDPEVGAYAGPGQPGHQHQD